MLPLVPGIVGVLTGAADAGRRVRAMAVADAAGVLVPFVVLAGLGLRRVPAAFRTTGRVLAPVSAVVMLVLGVALATGWYESLVGRLVT